MSDAFFHVGNAQPQDLTEDVVFTDSAASMFMVGYVVAMSAFTILFTVAATAEVLTNQWTLLRSSMWGISGLSLFFGLAASAWYWRDRLGTRVTVNSFGISLSRREILQLSCPWADLTITSALSEGLRDKQGRPISLIWLNSQHPDHLLARAVLRNRIRQLRRELANKEPARIKWSWWLLVPAISIGLVCLPLFRSVEVQFIAGYSDPGVDVGRRVLLFAELLGSGLGITLLFFALHMSQVPILSFFRKRERRKFAELAEFIDERKGRLEAVEMEPGRTYRYVCPKGLIRSDDMLALSILIGLVGIACFGALFADRVRSDPHSLWILVPGGVLFTAIAILCEKVAVERRRPLYARFSATNSGGIEILFDEKIVRCKVVKRPNRTRAASTSFCILSIVLKGDDGKTYRLDPRYLVPNE